MKSQRVQRKKKLASICYLVKWNFIGEEGEASLRKAVEGRVRFDLTPASDLLPHKTMKIPIQSCHFSVFGGMTDSRDAYG